MRTEVSPVMAGILIAIVVVIAGVFIWKQSEGKTYTKESARGIKFDLSKGQGGAPK